jgi:shikimate kinase
MNLPSTNLTPMNLLLIGYRGTGKTSVAQQLGLRLGWDWVDADVEVELRAGKCIAAIFADDGEEAFRDLETAIVTELAQRERTVMALGGGVILRPENRAAIRQAGQVVWLTATPETLWQRIIADVTTQQRRPNLTAAGGISEINVMLGRRLPFYQQCALLEVDTEAKSPAEIAEEIIARLGDSLDG